MAEQDLFGATIKEMAAGPHIGGHAALTKALMERLSEKGLPLEHLTDPKMMKRSRRTLEAHAREYGIAFPDYVPMALRQKLVFIQEGDGFQLVGDDAPKIANIVGAPVIKTRGKPKLIISASFIDEAKRKLTKAWYVVKLVRAKKTRKAVTHA